MSELHPRKISLTNEAKASFDALCQRFGMTQITAIARVVDWLQRQPEEIQALALGQIPDSIDADIIDLLYRRQASVEDIPTFERIGREAVAKGPGKGRKSRGQKGARAG